MKAKKKSHFGRYTPFLKRGIIILVSLFPLKITSLQIGSGFHVFIYVFPRFIKESGNDFIVQMEVPEMELCLAVNSLRL